MRKLSPPQNQLTPKSKTWRNILSKWLAARRPYVTEWTTINYTKQLTNAINTADVYWVTASIMPVENTLFWKALVLLSYAMYFLHVLLIPNSHHLVAQALLRARYSKQCCTAVKAQAATLVLSGYSDQPDVFSDFNSDSFWVLYVQGKNSYPTWCTVQVQLWCWSQQT